ncbi:hypothetical protein [Ralstonia phage phiRSL1]|uniref:Uncharacterized protein n=1 Tax=Ralstonia phage phiRSL1 TaxID=1980924 RepID=B2ZY99_9CAUD|nr:hypothetical protein RSL1_ORF285 [Ralstonia phage phiRSL1]BAG41732.1 hypothetical protein [Ralstonia phage phiRSL1]
MNSTITQAGLARMRMGIDDQFIDHAKILIVPRTSRLAARYQFEQVAHVPMKVLSRPKASTDPLIITFGPVQDTVPAVQYNEIAFYSKCDQLVAFCRLNQPRTLMRNHLVVSLSGNYSSPIYTIMPKNQTSTVELSRDEKNAIVTSLQMRICHMETGTVSLRANDAIRMKRQDMIRPLDEAQRKYIVNTEELIKRLTGD